AEHQVGEPAAPTKEYDLGVVFVHGIGSQVQGGTLMQFGEPLFRWLFRWFGDGTDPAGDVGAGDPLSTEERRRVRMTAMELQPTSADQPGRCVVELDLPPTAAGATAGQSDAGRNGGEPE